MSSLLKAFMSFFEFLCVAELEQLSRSEPLENAAQHSVTHS